MYFVNLLFRLLPPTRAWKFKTKCLRWAGVVIGDEVEYVSSAKIQGQMNLSIGKCCFIGHEALIFGAAGSSITLEDYAKVGSRSIVVTGYHRYSPDGDCIAKEGKCKDVVIKRGAVVSTNCIVLPGITVGEMAHVAAGSVVTKDVPPYTRVAGNPARPIRDLLTNERIG
jgi:acetyltransferase-like isoleucine patch superfamily enzyme